MKMLTPKLGQSRGDDSMTNLSWVILNMLPEDYLKDLGVAMRKGHPEVL